MGCLRNMHSSIICLFLLLLVFISKAWGANNTTGDLCKFVDCRHGICNSTAEILPKCDCFPGWSQPQIGGIALPSCILPNCTVNLTCGMPQLPPMVSPINITNPCNLVWCGDGTCEATDGGGVKCNCNAGAFNIQNQTNMPCIHECNLGSDCNSLDLGQLIPAIFKAPSPSMLPPSQPSPAAARTNSSSGSQTGAASSNSRSKHQMIGALAFMVFLVSLHFAI